jgi:hypothetical protein
VRFLAAAEIVYYPILGLPVIFWLGLITLLLFIITATIAVLNRRGIHTIPIRWHFILARFAIILGLIHSILYLLLFSGILT